MSTAIDAENDTGNDTKIARDAWRASPGGPFERHAHCQSSSGEHGQTSSGENDRVVFLDDGGPGTKRARMDSDGSVKTHESAVDVLRLGAHGEAFGARTAATKTALRAGSSKRLALKKNSPGAVHKTKPGQTRRNGVPPVDIPEGRMRCSRNDGKNWRCSEMAMPAHKHCQKHMRWSAGGRSKQRGGEREGASGAKRPRWLAEEIGNAHGQTPHSFPSHLVPFPGASNPLLAAPLLNVAATALDELRHKEAVLRAMSQGVASAFGAFGGFPGATAFSGFPGPNNAGATHRPTAQKAPVSIDSLGGIAQMRSAPVADFSATECLAPVTKTHAFAPRFVECDVELVPAPAGSGRGAQNRKKIDLSLVANFDDLHVALADVVGAARPAGGRYDPSALQIAYVGANGAPAVLGAEPWETWVSRVSFVQARLLAPGLVDDTQSSSPKQETSHHANAPNAFHAPWMAPPMPSAAYNPFAAMLGMGSTDPGTMAMLMSMFIAASGGEAGGTGNADMSNAFSAAALAAAAGFALPTADGLPPT